VQQSDLLLPDNLRFPLALTKLCMLVMYYELSDAITGDVTLKVNFGPDEKILSEVPLNRQELLRSAEGIPPPDVKADETERIIHLRIPISFSPLQIPSSGRLRVRAHYADESILKLGSLSLRQVPVDEFNRALAGGTLAPPS
jgi:hypothetical protein